MVVPSTMWWPVQLQFYPYSSHLNHLRFPCPVLSSLESLEEGRYLDDMSAIFFIQINVFRWQVGNEYEPLAEKPTCTAFASDHRSELSEERQLIFDLNMSGSLDLRLLHPFHSVVSSALQGSLPTRCNTVGECSQLYRNLDDFFNDFTNLIGFVRLFNKFTCSP